MIRIELFFSGAEISGFRIQGHAQAAPHGEDMVCAGVSAVAQAALLGLDAFLPGGFGWEIKKDGFMECFLHKNLTAEEQKASGIILETMMRGLRSIQESYGEYVSVMDRRCAEDV